MLSKSPALDATESDWCTVRVMVQQGEYELHRGQFDKALAYMDKAVKVGERYINIVGGMVREWVIVRFFGKSLGWQCLGICSADFWPLLA